MCYNIVDNTAKLAVTIFKNYICNMKRLSIIIFVLCLCSLASYANGSGLTIGGYCKIDRPSAGQ